MSDPSAGSPTRGELADAAEQLAAVAARIAENVEYSARVHEDIAATPGSPLREQAAHHASLDHEYAQHERREAQRFARISREHADG